MTVKPLKMRPAAREGSKAAAVQTNEALVIEGSSRGIGPAGNVFRFVDDFSASPWPIPMLVVEVDSLPIGKSFSCPDTGNAHGVVLECQPGVAFGNAALARIEPNGDGFVGDIGLWGDVASRSDQR